MAVAYLTENSTTLAAAAWSDAAGFVIAATLIIDRNTAQTIGTAVDQSAIAQIDYLKIGKGFNGTIGTSASPLKFGANSTATNTKGFFNDSGGIVYFQAANILGGGAAANTIGYYSHSGVGRAYAIGGALTTADVGSGYFEIGQGVTNTTLNVCGGEVFVDYNASAGTTLNIYGGRVYTKRQYTNVNVYGGSLIYDITATITNGTLVAGARWDHRGGDITNGILAGAFTVQNLNRSCTIGVTSLITTANSNINRTTSSTVSATFSNEVKVAGGPQTGYTPSLG